MTDICIKETNNIYEDIAVYAEEPAFAIKDATSFVDELSARHGFKLECTGPVMSSVP